MRSLLRQIKEKEKKKEQTEFAYIFAHYLISKTSKLLQVAFAADEKKKNA